jgi:hypothetical protein
MNRARILTMPPANLALAEYYNSTNSLFLISDLHRRHTAGYRRPWELGSAAAGG